MMMMLMMIGQHRVRQSTAYLVFQFILFLSALSSKPVRRPLERFKMVQWVRTDYLR